MSHRFSLPTQVLCGTSTRILLSQQLGQRSINLSTVLHTIKYVCFNRNFSLSFFSQFFQHFFSPKSYYFHFFFIRPTTIKITMTSPAGLLRSIKTTLTLIFIFYQIQPTVSQLGTTDIIVWTTSTRSPSTTTTSATTRTTSTTPSNHEAQWKGVAIALLTLVICVIGAIALYALKRVYRVLQRSASRLPLLGQDNDAFQMTEV